MQRILESVAILSAHTRPVARMVPRMVPDASASLELLECGARLVFTPGDPANLDEVRQHVRARQQQLQLGQRPMSDVQHKGRAG